MDLSLKTCLRGATGAAQAAPTAGEAGLCAPAGIEQQSFNPRVQGSIPWRPTTASANAARKLAEKDQRTGLGRFVAAAVEQRFQDVGRLPIGEPPPEVAVLGHRQSRRRNGIRHRHEPSHVSWGGPTKSQSS